MMITTIPPMTTMMMMVTTAHGFIVKGDGDGKKAMVFGLEGSERFRCPVG